MERNPTEKQLDREQTGRTTKISLEQWKSQLNADFEQTGFNKNKHFHPSIKNWKEIMEIFAGTYSKLLVAGKNILQRFQRPLFEDPHNFPWNDAIKDLKHTMESKGWFDGHTLPLTDAHYKEYEDANKSNIRNFIPSWKREISIFTHPISQLQTKDIIMMTLQIGAADVQRVFKGRFFKEITKRPFTEDMLTEALFHFTGQFQLSALCQRQVEGGYQTVNLVTPCLVKLIDYYENDQSNIYRQTLGQHFAKKVRQGDVPIAANIKQLDGTPETAALRELQMQNLCTTSLNHLGGIICSAPRIVNQLEMANDSGIAAAPALALGSNNKSVAVVQARPSGQSVGKTTISPEHLRLMKEQKKRMLQQQQQKNKTNHQMILAANDSSVATTSSSSSTIKSAQSQSQPQSVKKRRKMFVSDGQLLPDDAPLTDMVAQVVEQQIDSGYSLINPPDPEHEEQGAATASATNNISATVSMAKSSSATPDSCSPQRLLMKNPKELAPTNPKVFVNLAPTVPSMVIPGATNPPPTPPPKPYPLTGREQLAREMVRKMETIDDEEYISHIQKTKKIKLHSPDTDDEMYTDDD
eukprot:Seg4957.3 transcript_id=Seg4957.3/GoldUCD/mRNA.D3Y31 product="hypothetical protein" protein_id=Seg4957.3/GoldUCD/D3Y31